MAFIRHRFDPVLAAARGGSVIIVVLVTLLFASVALTLFIEKATNDLLVDVREADAARLRTEAYSALETTLGVLEEFRAVLGALRSPAEGWADPLGFVDYEPSPGRVVEIQFIDESAKMSLPSVDGATLVELFKSWEMTQGNAEKLRDALLSWMKKDHVPGSAAAPRPEDYDRGDLPIEPPFRPLRSYHELASIEYARDVFYDREGEPTELWHRFVEAFSLYQYDKANVNGGNPHVLAGLGIVDKSQQRRVADYLSGRGAYQQKGAGYFKDAGEIGTLLGGNSPASELSTQISALRIIVVVREGRSTFRLNAVVAPQGGATIPQADGNQEESDGSSPQPAQPTPTPAPQAAGAARQASETKSLNYPFTILEIRENDEIPSDDVGN